MCSHANKSDSNRTQSSSHENKQCCIVARYHYDVTVKLTFDLLDIKCHCITLDISVKCCHNQHMNYCCMADNMFCEVTVTVYHQNVINSLLSQSGR